MAGLAFYHSERRIKFHPRILHQLIGESRLDCGQGQNLLWPVVRWCVNTPWHSRLQPVGSVFFNEVSKLRIRFGTCWANLARKRTIEYVPVLTTIALRCNLP